MSHPITSKSEAALEVVLAPSSIPPAPQSGVVLTGSSTPSSSSSPTSSARSAAVPCAAFWPGAAAAETLRTSQVLTVAADELDWLYENTDDETDPSCIQARAAIEGWLSELSFEHQQVIALQHNPTAWPEDLLAGDDEDSYALVLHSAWPSGPRDRAYSTVDQQGTRARRRLEIGLERNGERGYRANVRNARWLFEDALRAYAEVRGCAASVVPEASRGFAASFDLEAAE
jgi:hypothetical protein